MAPASVSEAVEQYGARGYAADFRAEPEGLRVVGGDRLFAPEDLVVDDLARFEGTSDPDDEAVVFALRARDGSVRGTWTVAFGPGMAPLDGEMARRLESGRPGIRPRTP